jgi:hypothetical protein
MKEIEIEILREFLDYDNETATLYWKERDRKWFNHDKYHYTWNKRFAGKPAGRKKGINGGYKTLAMFDQSYRYHRVIWALVHGEWPEHFIDHIDGDPTNNKIENLRPVSNSENSANRKKVTSNTGFKGVHKLKNKDKYLVTIEKNYKQYNLGRYDTPEEAHAVYCAKAKELFGEYANFGS